jgi:hypothetical protein
MVADTATGPSPLLASRPAGPAAPAGQAGAGAAVGGGGGGQPGVAVVAPADRRVAALAFPQEPLLGGSHETSYRSLFLQRRGGLGRARQRGLRGGGGRWATDKASGCPRGDGRLREVVVSSQPPAEAEDRAVPGHWEGELWVGRRPRRW